MKTSGYIGLFALLILIILLCWTYLENKKSEQAPIATDTTEVKYPLKKDTLKASLTLSPFTLSFIESNGAYLLEPCSSSAQLTIQSTQLDSSISSKKRCSLNPKLGDAKAYIQKDSLYLIWEQISQGRYHRDTTRLPLQMEKGSTDIESNALANLFAEELSSSMTNYFIYDLEKRERLIQKSCEIERKTGEASTVLMHTTNGIRITSLKDISISVTLEAESL